MPASETVAVGLADAIEALREELQDSFERSVGEQVRFEASAVVLTVQVVARKETTPGAKLRWWVVEVGVDRKSGTELTQTLELTLTPKLFDDRGNPSTLSVSGVQPTPAG